MATNTSVAVVVLGNLLSLKPNSRNSIQQGIRWKYLFRVLKEKLQWFVFLLFWQSNLQFVPNPSPNLHKACNRNLVWAFDSLIQYLYRPSQVHPGLIFVLLCMFVTYRCCQDFNDKIRLHCKPAGRFWKLEKAVDSWPNCQKTSITSQSFQLGLLCSLAMFLIQFPCLSNWLQLVL